jgi:hypothetical protein
VPPGAHAGDAAAPVPVGEVGVVLAGLTELSALLGSLHLAVAKPAPSTVANPSAASRHRADRRDICIIATPLSFESRCFVS